jgi:acylphosphatase
MSLAASSAISRLARGSAKRETSCDPELSPGKVLTEGGLRMRMHDLWHRKAIGIAAATGCILVAIAPALAKSKVNDQSVTAVSGIVTGNVQEVGFRAMIQKQAIQYNLAGSAENDSDKSVRFTVQGNTDRVDQVLKAIRLGSKKSSDVKVSTSAATVDPNLKTFTVVGWTSVSRHITHPYDLVFKLRENDATIKKGAAKEVWIKICESTVQGDDAGKCDKDKDD